MPEVIPFDQLAQDRSVFKAAGVNLDSPAPATEISFSEIQSPGGESILLDDVADVDTFYRRPKNELFEDDTFDPRSYFSQNPDVANDPAQLQKLLDVYRGRRERGLTFGAVKEAAKSAVPTGVKFVKGAGKLASNVFEFTGLQSVFNEAASVVTGDAFDSKRSAALGEESDKRATKALAEFQAGTELSATGIADLGRTGTRKIFGKAVKDLTDQELLAQLSEDASFQTQLSEVQQGRGESLKAAGLDADTLAKQGIELDPEAIENLSLVDPATVFATAGIFKGTASLAKLTLPSSAARAAGNAARTEARAVGATVTQTAEAASKAARMAALAEGATAEAAERAATWASTTSKASDALNTAVKQAIGKTVQGTGKVVTGAARATGAVAEILPAEAVGVALGAAKGGPLGALAGAASAGRIQTGVVRGSEKLAEGGRRISEIGREIAGEVPRSAGLEKIFRVAGSPVVKGTVGGAVVGTVAAAPLALLTDDDIAAGGILGGGLVLGTAAGTAIGTKVAIGEFAAKKQFDPHGQPLPVIHSPDYGIDAALDTTHAREIQKLPVTGQGVVTTFREATRGTGGEIYSTDKPGFRQAIFDEATRRKGAPLTPTEVAAVDAASNHLGLFDANVPNPNGGTRRVIFLNSDAKAVPHEAGHLFQALLSPERQEALRSAVREFYTPGQLADFQSRYEARLGTTISPEVVIDEIVAENFSAIFNNVPVTELTAPKGFLSKLGETIAEGAEALGIDLTGGRRTPDLQAPVSHQLRKIFENAAREVVEAGKLVEPTPVLAPAPVPAPAPVRNIRITPGQQDAFAKRAADTGITEARQLAATDPEVAARVNEVSASMEAGNPVLEIEHLGIKSLGSATTPEGRTSRRGTQEAGYVELERLRVENRANAPESVVNTHQKTFVPVRWTNQGGTPTLIAMSIDKVISNTHRIVREAADKNASALIPYPTENGRLTEAAWQEVVKDAQSYAENQHNGFRGDGQRLVRPTEDVGFSIPTENPDYRPTVLDPAKSDFHNLLQGLATPETARVQKGATPGNIKGQIVAEAQGRALLTPADIKPKNVSKQEFTGFPGRSLKEVNPLRNELAKRGVPVRELIEVTERIRAKDIASIKPRPDINFKAPVTDIIRGGFLPSQEKPLNLLAEEVKKRIPPGGVDGEKLFGRGDVIGDWHAPKGTAEFSRRSMVGTGFEDLSNVEFVDWLWDHQKVLTQQKMPGINRGPDMPPISDPRGETPRQAYAYAAELLDDLQSRPSETVNYEVSDIHRIKNQLRWRNGFFKSEKTPWFERLIGKKDAPLFDMSGGKEKAPVKIETPFSEEQINQTDWARVSDAVRGSWTPPAGYAAEFPVGAFDWVENYFNTPNRPSLNSLSSAEQQLASLFLREAATQFIRRNVQFLPAELTERAAQVISASPDEFRTLTSDWEGGLTGEAWRIGRGVKSEAEVAILKQLQEQEQAKGREAMKSGDFDAAMPQILKGQFFREAWEAATGEGSAGVGLPRRDPGYVPPFPTESTRGKFPVAPGALSGNESAAFLPKPSPEVVREFSSASPLMKDTGGTPKVFFHGSFKSEELVKSKRWDLSKTFKRGLYGPGFYFTDSASAAGGPYWKNRLRALFGAEPLGYAVKPTGRTGGILGVIRAEKENLNPSPGVFPAFINLKNPFDASREFSPKETAQILEHIPKTRRDRVPRRRNRVENFAKVGGQGQELYQLLTDFAEHAEVQAARDYAGDTAYAKPVVNSWLEAAGFDGVVYPGGVIRGGVGKHGVVVAWRPEQVISALDQTAPPGELRGAENFAHGGEIKFLPKSNDLRAVQTAAVRNVETGEVFSGMAHGDAMKKATLASGVSEREFSLSIAYSDPNLEQGFVTKGGEFLNRAESLQRAEELGQILPEARADSSQLGKGENLESVGFQSNRKFLPADEAGANPEKVARARQEWKKRGVGSRFFRKWFSSSQAKDRNGEPLLLYHGTTQRFSIFDPTLANPENDLGKAIYLSSSPEDVTRNYQGEGPDLRGRIEDRAEWLADAIDKDGEPLYSETEAIDIARRELLGPVRRRIKVFARVENPLILGGPDETYFDYQSEKEGYAGGLLDLLDAIESDSRITTQELRGFRTDLLEVFAPDEPYRAREVIDSIKSDLIDRGITDTEGNSIDSDVVRAALERLGYDGIIDRSVKDKFPNMFKNLPEDIVHVIVFKSEQVKAVGGIPGTTKQFIPTNPDIRFLPRLKRNAEGQPLTKDGLIDYERLYKEMSAQKKRADAEDVDLSKYDIPSNQTEIPGIGRTGPTGWILPDKSFVSLATAYHEQYLADNAPELNKKFGTKFGAEPDVEERLAALNKGFVRVRYEARTGGLHIEASADAWRKLKPAVVDHLLENEGQIDNLNVSLLDAKGQVVDSIRKRLVDVEGRERADKISEAVNSLRPRN